MSNGTRWIASALVSGLALLCVSAAARAQAPQIEAVGRVASLASGSIGGVVQDEKGAPVVGAMVSALGATTAFAITDRTGRFELRTLSPGPYLVRAHLTGFAASRGQIVEVRPSARASSAIALHHVTQTASGASGPVVPASVAAAAPEPPGEAPDTAVGSTGTTGSTTNDDGSETAWRLRHARRSILKDATLPEDLLADNSPDGNIFGGQTLFGRAVETSARAATSFLVDTPFSGQFNLLTTGSFDTPQQLFTANSFARNIAYLSVGAPVGEHADWTIRGAITQGDLSSWILAGEYRTRAPARHRYDIGLSYATQRYDGGNPAALRNVTDGSRNAGTVYAYDTFALSRAVSIEYGGRYSQYDYLDGQSLLSPRAAVTIAPGDHFRINTLVSSRAIAPGAEEFAPPADSAVWMPPQRTFSSLVDGRQMTAEHALHVEAELERDLAAGATVSVRAFKQSVDNQLVTMFGVEMPGRPSSALGHYFVASNGGVDATGWSAGLRAAIGDRFHGAVEYSAASAQWHPTTDLAYLIFFAPSALRLAPERIQDLNGSLEADVPETSTRVIVVYRVSDGFARADSNDHGLDSRFDVQVRQSLPFMDFSTAKWEMLVAVRNFYRDAALGQSVYDELLVIRPPKRVVGGLTLRF